MAVSLTSTAAPGKAGQDKNKIICHGFYNALPARCGICGDAWNASPAEHEAPGGRFANGILVASYTPSQDIDVTVLVTANHKVSHVKKFCSTPFLQGFFTFRLCRNNNVQQDPDQSCFHQPQSLLRLSPSGELRFLCSIVMSEFCSSLCRYEVTTAMGTGEMTMRLRLPDWTCEQCILQWTYTAGGRG